MPQQEPPDFNSAIKALIEVKNHPDYNTLGRGVIECPKCHGKLHWFTAGPKRHARGKCETPDCIQFME